MKRYTVTFLIFALLALTILFYPQQFSNSGVVIGQKRSQRLQRSPRRVAGPRAARIGVDYSNFSHATKKHQGACNTCHKVPTANWKKARDFPDVADYPGHDACVSCHRPQFFKGAKPAICSVCHSKISPRDEVRFAFRNPAAPRQFLIEFPHDRHQDVIARLERPVTQTISLRAGAQSRFLAAETWKTNSVRYSHPSARFAAVEAKHYNNCEICHAPRTTAPVVPATGWTDGFVPDAATFKTVPANHAACFNCHWNGQQPTNENCAGCHKLAAKPFLTVDAPKRFSLKFRHARERHADECTNCHINITKATTLRGLKPDVPITSCSECHNKAGLRLDVSGELEAIDKNRGFVCSYCHTSDVGRLDPPSSHYLISSRKPMKRMDVK